MALVGSGPMVWLQVTLSPEPGIDELNVTSGSSWPMYMPLSQKRPLWLKALWTFGKPRMSVHSMPIFNGRWIGLWPLQSKLPNFAALMAVAPALVGDDAT